MDVKLIIFETIPPLAGFILPNENLFMIIRTDYTQFCINIADSLSNPKGKLFKTKNDIIKFTLFKGKEYLGVGQFEISDEVRWITIHDANHYKNNQKLIINHLTLRIKCSFISSHINNKKSQQNKSNLQSLLSGSKMNKIECSNSTSLLDYLSSSIEHKNQGLIKNNNQSDTKSSYLRQKYCKLAHHQRSGSFNHNTETLALNNVSHSGRLNDIQRKFKKRTKVYNNELNSLSYYTTNSMTECKINSTMKRFLSPFNKKSITAYQERNDLEEIIIDKSYENNLKNDELLYDRTTTPNKNNSENYKVIEDNDECSLESFITLKEDFFLLYEDDYLTNIPIDTIGLETGLYIEKFIEMQCKYNSIMKEMINHYYYYNHFIKESNESLIKVTKMRNKLALQTMQCDYTNTLKETSIAPLNLMTFYKKVIGFWNTVEPHINTHKSNTKIIKGAALKERLSEIVGILFNRSNKVNKLKYLDVYQKYYIEKIIQNKKQKALILRNSINSSEQQSHTVDKTNPKINNDHTIKNNNIVRFNSVASMPSLSINNQKQNNRKTSNQKSVHKGKTHHFSFNKCHKS